MNVGGRAEVVDHSYSRSSGGGSQYQSGGSRRGYGQNGYFESGHIGNSNSVDEEDQQLGGGGRGGHRQSGSSDSGWVMLSNGSYVRRQSSWSSESSYGGVSLSQDDRDELKHHLNHDGDNNEDGSSGEHSTGWVKQPDGTMIKTSSSWSSWSSSNYQGGHPDDLNRVKDQIDRKFHDEPVVPPNVEPGFEDRYKRKLRYTLWQYLTWPDSFDNDLNISGENELMMTLMLKSKTVSRVVAL